MVSSARPPPAPAPRSTVAVAPVCPDGRFEHIRNTRPEPAPTHASGVSALVLHGQGLQLEIHDGGVRTRLGLYPRTGAVWTAPPARGAGVCLPGRSGRGLSGRCYRSATRLSASHVSCGADGTQTEWLEVRLEDQLARAREGLARERARTRLASGRVERGIAENADESAAVRWYESVRLFQTELLDVADRLEHAASAFALAIEARDTIDEMSDRAGAYRADGPWASIPQAEVLMDETVPQLRRLARSLDEILDSPSPSD